MARMTPPAALAALALALACPHPAQAGLLGWAVGANGTIVHTSDGGALAGAAWRRRGRRRAA